MMNTLRAQYSNYTFYDAYLVLSDTTRHVFFGLYLVVAVGSLIGNLAAICSIIKRKCRYIQKTCIISLALSDLVSTISVSVNNLETFSHPLINWTLGDFLCDFIPLCQFWGMVISSFTLVIIAMDRYRNVVHALSKKWDPKLPYCIIYLGGVWIVSLAISSPMYTFYDFEPINLVYYNETNGTIVNDSIVMFPTYTCLTFVKDDLMIFYVSTVFIVYLPLLLIFLWLYYNVAKLIWTHRKPVTIMFKQKLKEMNQNSSSQGDTTDDKTIEQTKIEEPKEKIMTRNEGIRMERKIRTFKIIITLMLVFLLCRLPTHIFTMVKLTEHIDGESMWILGYTFTLLTLINSLLNPLLYTFLNQTINAWRQIKKAINEIVCCCCSSTEFDDFERGNPFVVENFERYQNCQQPQQDKLKIFNKKY